MINEKDLSLVIKDYIGKTLLSNPLFVDGLSDTICQYLRIGKPIFNGSQFVLKSDQNVRDNAVVNMPNCSQEQLVDVDATKLLCERLLDKSVDSKYIIFVVNGEINCSQASIGTQIERFNMK